MSAWQYVQEQTVLVEREVAIVLLILAGVLAAPALRTLMSPSDLRMARSEFAQRVRWISHAARGAQTDYLIVLEPDSGEMRAMRWRRGAPRPRPDRQLFGQLSNGVVVESTTLPRHSITISDQGFVLSTGSVVLLAPNGDRLTVDIGELGQMRAVELGAL